MTSSLAYISDACFDSGPRFRFSNLRIGREHISRLRPAIGDTTRGRFFRVVVHVCESMWA